MARVARFNVTPVKSTSLLHPDEISLVTEGVPGDHVFMVVDEAGRRLSGAAKAPLLGVRAVYHADHDHLTLRTTDGIEIEGSGAGTGAPSQVTLFDRDVTVRRVQGPFDDSLTSIVGRPMRLVRAVAPETTGGVHRVSIVSLSAVEELGRRADRRTPDARRFRMLAELSECQAHEEDGWLGRRVRLGDAIVKVEARVPRCAVATMHPDTGGTDFPTLDVLATYRRSEEGLVFGVYADVERAGVVRVGDDVRVLDARADGQQIG